MYRAVRGGSGGSFSFFLLSPSSPARTASVRPRVSPAAANRASTQRLPTIVGPPRRTFSSRPPPRRGILPLVGRLPQEVPGSASAPGGSAGLQGVELARVFGSEVERSPGRDESRPDPAAHPNPSDELLRLAVPEDQYLA